jgi:hypothetical protein
MRRIIVAVTTAASLVALGLPARAMTADLHSRGSFDFDPVIVVGGVERAAEVGDVVLEGEEVQPPTRESWWQGTV